MKRAALVLCLLCACGPGEAVVDGAEATLATDGAALGAESMIIFHDDWNISRRGLFIEGGKVRVAYEAKRLPGCRGDQNGHPAWSITGYARVNDGPVQSFEAGGFSPSGGSAQPVIDLPAAGKVAFWFQLTNVWGCTAWDSNYGENFVYEIGPAPRIAFAADWSETVYGMPGAAPNLRIDYDLSRLPNCRQGYNGLPTWEVLVFWRFDGGAVSYTPVTRTNGTQRVAAPANLVVPPGAQEVELWFKASDRAGCVQFDSDYGRNYRWRVG